MFYIFKVKFYTAIRMNDLKLHTVIWVYLKNNVKRNRDPSSILRLERSPGGGHGNPFQYSCPENPMDRGAWTIRF